MFISRPRFVPRLPHPQALSFHTLQSTLTIQLLLLAVHKGLKKKKAKISLSASVANLLGHMLPKYSFRRSNFFIQQFLLHTLTLKIIYTVATGKTIIPSTVANSYYIY